MQNLTVPVGINYVYADVIGASSGTGTGGTPGYGARVQTYFPVANPEKLYIFVGCQGTNFNPGSCHQPGGFNGGGSGACYSPGGGGASDIRRGGSTLSKRVVVAGGGGGFAAGKNCGTQKGGNAGQFGSTGTPASLSSCDGYGQPGGGGGNWTTGGSVGTFGSPTPGTLGVGGNGGSMNGGGGGGGYYGGTILPSKISFLIIFFVRRRWF